MATPANRVPVRIARGSKANLDTAIAAGDLKEGEICYAADENGIYVVEGGVLTQAGADLASTSIDALSDVDTTTVAPTNGQVLVWNNVDSEWQPANTEIVSDTTPQLGGNLDVNGSYIVSAGGGNVEVAPDTTGDFVVRGNDTDGSITLNCTANTHGVTIQSPPHSAAATYTLTLPDDTGTSGQVLSTDGTGALSWAASANPARTTAAATTASLADAAAGDITITSTGKAGQLLSIETDQAAWVTLYCTQNARTLDASRLETEDPGSGSGVLAEVVTTAAQEVLVTPAVNYFNFETTPASELYAKVVNKAGATTTITVTLSIVPVES